MLQIKVESHYKQEPEVFSINSWEDFAQLYKVYPRTRAIVANSGTLASAARNIAKYLSGNAMTATVLDPDDLDGMDDEILSQDDLDEVEFPHDPQSLDDVKNYLEAKKDYETVDIPPSVVAQGATHRWDQEVNNDITLDPESEDEFAKSEILQKDRGRITFPADPKITNRPDQEVAQIATLNQKKSKEKEIANKISSGLKNTFGDEVADKNKDAVSDASQINPNLETGRTVRLKTAGSKPISYETPENKNMTDISGRTTTEHEGFHNLMSQISTRHGEDTAKDFSNAIYSKITPESQDKVGNWITSKKGYNPNDEYFKEEVIAHIRDLLHNRQDRASYQKHHNLSDENMQTELGRFGSDWKNAMGAASSYKLPNIQKNEVNSVNKYLMSQIFASMPNPKKDKS